MPTREEMIAALAQSQRKAPSREEMIAALSGAKKEAQSTEDVPPTQWDPWEEKTFEYLKPKLQAVAPYISPVMKVVDYPFGLLRSGTAMGLGAVKNLSEGKSPLSANYVTEEDAKNTLLGSAPSMGEYFKKLGVPTGGVTRLPLLGNVSTRGAAGLAADIALSPTGVWEDMGNAAMRGSRKLLSATSGVPAAATENFLENYPRLNQMINDKSVTNYVENLQQGAQGVVNQAQNNALKSLQNIYPTLDKNVATTTAQEATQKANKLLQQAQNIAENKLSGAQKAMESSAKESYVKALTEHFGTPNLEEGVNQRMEDIVKNLQESYVQKKLDLGRQFEEALPAGEGTAKSTDVLEPLFSTVRKLESSPLAQTPHVQSEISALKEQIIGIGTNLPEDLTAQGLFDLQDILKANANYTNTTFQKGGSGLSRADKLWQNANKQAYSKVNTELERLAGLSGLKSEYSDLLKHGDFLETHFSDPQKTFSTLKKISSSDPGSMFIRKDAQGISGLTSFDLAKEANAVKNYDTLVKTPEKIIDQKAFDSLSQAKQAAQKNIQSKQDLLSSTLGDSTNLDKQIGMSPDKWSSKQRQAADMVKNLSGTDISNLSTQVGNAPLLEDLGNEALKGITPEVNKYQELNQMFNRYLSSPEKAYKSLSGIEAPSKVFQKKEILDLKNSGIDLGQAAKDLESYRYFENPGLAPYSTGGSTSTSRTLIGTGVGGMLGSFFGPQGSALGTGIGYAATSPLALKKVVGAQHAITPYAQKFSEEYLPTLLNVKNPWIELNKEKKP